MNLDEMIVVNWIKMILNRQTEVVICQLSVSHLQIFLYTLHYCCKMILREREWKFLKLKY